MAQELEFKKVSKTEEEVAQMFRRYVSKDRYEQFIKENAKNIERISKGMISEVLTLNNNKNGEEYLARITGVLVCEEKKFEKFDCIYKRKELLIPESLKLSNSVISLTQDQIQKLRTDSRLDQTIVDNKGCEYIIAVDKELNRLALTNTSILRITNKLHGVELDENQVSDLKAGKTITYERPSPFAYKEIVEGDMLVLTAYYDPILRTIRSANMLDEHGNIMVNKDSQIRESVIEKPQQVPEKSSALKNTEKKTTVKKARTKKVKAPKQAI